MILDLDLLRYCRDDECKTKALHLAHGKRARALSVRKTQVCVYCDAEYQSTKPLCPACWTPERRRQLTEVEEEDDDTPGLIESTYKHIGDRVPTALGQICMRVHNDYGRVTVRSINRALATLVDERRIVSFANPHVPLERQKTAQPLGLYIRYDSPKLWSPDGFRDLRSLALDHIAADYMEWRNACDN